MITFGRRAEIRLTPTIINSVNKDGVFSRIPGKLSQDSQGCVECALREASLMMTDDVETKIILVTASAPEKQEEIQQSLEMLSKRSEVMMMVMNNQWMLETGSVQVFHVSKEEQKSVSDLFDILSMTLESQHTGVKFFSHQHSALSNQRLSGKFVVEDSLRSNMFVSTSSLMQEDIELFKLISPTGAIFNFPVLDKGQAYFQFSDSVEAGVWSYEVKLTPITVKSQVPVHVSAYADQTSHTGAVTLETWTHTDTDLLTDDDTPAPVIIYTRVSEEEMPVVGADVTAEVSTPDGDTVKIVLHDSGTGYPDLESGDGIYSGYLTEFSQLAGLYSVKVEVSNHEGRASVVSYRQRDQRQVCGRLDTHLIPSLHFTRFLRSPSFFLSRGVRYEMVEGVPVRKDVYPPARITNLRVSPVNDLSLELSWTASGDDLDHGAASRYQIRWSEDRESLKHNFTSAGHMLDAADLEQPRQFGLTESLNITVPRVNTQLYLAIIAVDDADNESPVSNIVPVLVHQDLVTESSLQHSHVSSLTLPEMSTSAWVYILSISLATLTLIIIMLVVIVIRRRRMRKLQENCPIPYFIELGPPSSNTEKTDHQVRDYPDDTLSYPASPAHTHHQHHQQQQQHPVLELYHQHARQYQMYQNLQQQQSDQSSGASSDSDKHSDRQSPSSSSSSSSWQRQFTPASDSHTSSSSSHRQSRRRRESFV